MVLVLEPKALYWKGESELKARTNTPMQWTRCDNKIHCLKKWDANLLYESSTPFNRTFWSFRIIVAFTVILSNALQGNNNGDHDKNTRNNSQSERKSFLTSSAVKNDNRREEKRGRMKRGRGEVRTRPDFPRSWSSRRLVFFYLTSRSTDREGRTARTQKRNVLTRCTITWSDGRPNRERMGSRNNLTLCSGLTFT